MAEKETVKDGPLTRNEMLLLSALEYLRRASETSDPAKKVELLEQAHRLQRSAEMGILEDVRLANLVARDSHSTGENQ
jgi:hypothetical protein